MHVIPSLRPNPLCTVVCCQHGDERFGLTVFEKLSHDISRRANVQLILANEDAVEHNRRYREQDLNRSFPGDATGSYEERVASMLLPIAQRSTYVIDVHTTTAAIRMTPIFSAPVEIVAPVLRACESDELVQMSPAIATRSLVGNVRAGVSLEFGEDYSHSDDAYAYFLRILDGICAGTVGIPRVRHLYHVTGVIPTDVILPEGVRDFDYIDSLGVYPFLLHERSYAFQAFAASSMTEVNV